MTPTLAIDNPAASIIGGLIARKQLAAELHCSERTVIRHERAGMPYIKLGALRLYDPAKVRAWVLDHEHRPSAPKRARPAKQAP